MCHSSREGLWLALLGPVTLAGDEGHLTALGLKQFSPEDGQESSKTRGRTQRGYESGTDEVTGGMVRMGRVKNMKKAEFTEHEDCMKGRERE